MESQTQAVKSHLDSLAAPDNVCPLFRCWPRKVCILDGGTLVLLQVLANLTSNTHIQNTVEFVRVTYMCVTKKKHKLYKCEKRNEVPTCVMHHGRFLISILLLGWGCFGLCFPTKHLIWMYVGKNILRPKNTTQHYTKTFTNNSHNAIKTHLSPSICCAMPGNLHVCSLHDHQGSVA